MKTWTTTAPTSTVDDEFAGQEGTAYGESAYGVAVYGAVPMPPSTTDWTDRDR